MSSAEVVLGFLEETEPWRLLSPQFPSKVGGKPAWLSQSGLPSLPGLECEICRLPMAFLLQVSGPEKGAGSAGVWTFVLQTSPPSKLYVKQLYVSVELSFNDWKKAVNYRETGINS